MRCLHYELSSIRLSACGNIFLFNSPIRRNGNLNFRNISEQYVRNIAIVAHIDAGKTTVTERMLFYSGVQKRIGDVDKGNTTTDFMQEEMERGITIQAAAVTFPWKHHIINLIDTPGHVDFNIEVERSLRVLEGVIGVFDAAVGVQGQSHMVLQQAQKYQIPMIAFINKMDKPNANFDRAVDTLRKKLLVCPLCLQIPIGDGFSGFEGLIDLLDMKTIRWETSEGTETKVLDLIEEPDYVKSIATAGRLKLMNDLLSRDENLVEATLSDMEKYNFDETTAKLQMKRDLIVMAIRRQCQDMKDSENKESAAQVVPVLCGAARRNKGIQPLMDAVIDILPAPKGIRKNIQDSITNFQAIQNDVYSMRDSAALVFKVSVYEHGRRGMLSFFRVYSGRFSKGKYFNSTRNCVENINQVFVIQGKAIKPVDFLPPGCIGVTFSETSHTGDTWIHLSLQRSPFQLPGIDTPLPVVSSALEPFENDQEVNIIETLRTLCREDPSLRTRESNHGEIILQGMGDLHLEITLSKMQRLFGLSCKLKYPAIEYQESIENEIIILNECIQDTSGKTVLEIGLRFTPVRDKIDRDRISPNKVDVQFDLDDTADSDKLEKDLRVSGHLRSDIKKILQQSQEFIEKYHHHIRQSTGDILANSPRLHAEFIGAQLTFTKIIVYSDARMLLHEVERYFSFFVSKVLRNAQTVIVEPFMHLEVNLVDVTYTVAVVHDLRQRSAKSVEVNDEKDGVCATLSMKNLRNYSTALRKITKGHAHYWYKLDHYRTSESICK